MNFTLDDYARATFGAAKNPDDSSLLKEQLDAIIKYLNSPGSGLDAKSSFAGYLNKGIIAGRT